MANPSSSSRTLLILLGALAACSSDPANPGDDDPMPDAPAPQPDGPTTPPEAPEAVYTLSNEADANRVIVYTRGSDGSLVPSSAYATGGKGSAGGLGSQGALVFDDASDRFFAVNAGNDTISMLALESDGSLAMRAVAPSGGVRPISITVRGDVAYVVNAGNATTPANISGFRIAATALTPIAGSSQPLSAAQPAPAQIEFSPDGKLLVVTEKGTNMIGTYALTDDVAQPASFHPSAGQTPFGFAWSASGHLIVSEAFGGGAGLGATTSYALAATGDLTPKSNSVKTAQSAPCWVAITGGHAYVTNTGSNTVTSFTVAADGSLTLDQTSGVAATTSMTPIDVDASDDGEFLYVLDAGADAIGIYAIGADGALTRMPDQTGISASAVGIVAR